MVFMIFIKSFFQDYVLPNINDSDYLITIKRSYGTWRSFYLRFEVINNKWSIKSDDSCYQLIHHKKNVDFVTLNGGEIITIKTAGGDIIKGIAVNSEMSLMSFEKYDIYGSRRITIGAAEENVIKYSFMKLVSQRHCIIENRNGKFIIYNTSRNGTFVNHRAVVGEQKLCSGDLIEIFGLKIILFDGIIAVGSEVGNFKVSDKLSSYKVVVSDISKENLIVHKDIYFNRAPRIIPEISRETVVIEPPTNQQFSKKQSLLMTVGPSFTMAIPMLLGCILMVISSVITGTGAGIFMMTGVITALGSGIFGAVWALLNVRNARRNEMEDETQRFNAYGNYLIEVSEYIKKRYRQNTDALYSMYPSPSECCRYNGRSSELWNRNSSHSDFLFYRLGLGDIDFQVNIQIPKERFSVTYDLLKDKPALLYENYKVLCNVPVGLDFSKHNIYGIAGGKRKAGVYDIVNSIIAQIAATTSYTDVKIVFCTDKTKCRLDKWEYIKWLPHTWSEDKKFRFFATDKQEVSDTLYELTDIIRQRADRADLSYDKMQYTPHYFLFLYDYKMIDNELIGKYIFDSDKNYGLTTIILTDYYNNLPNACENIIQNDENYRGYYNALGRNTNSMSINFDKVSTRDLNMFAQSISNLIVKENEDDSAVPSSLDFFEMYNISDVNEIKVIDRWRKNRTYNSMKALIGKKAGGADCYLDIHEKYHGPHGLIAGTTGSGKSELIQTLILSLAVNYSPEDIAFFIIDFKGGGMANLFSDLPHLAGQISNLSGNQIHRAMISIKSENLRRQKLFGEYSVNNINNYTRLYKSGEAPIPIPHLLIIIDEFAELKKEEPDFMRELISVAQVGRSLGVHLILATQKPTGTVDDNIWSNAKFRLCLRVQDRQDSNDIIHRTDAAYITQAGRCYMQVGNDEIFDLFQSGWSGAVCDNLINSGKDEIATMITNTGKTALIGNHTKARIRERDKLRWFTFLCREYKKAVSSDTALSENDLAESLLAVARENGYNIGTGAAEVNAMRSFISLIPPLEKSPESCAKQVYSSANKKGLKMPELKDKTQLEVIVEYISKKASDAGYSNRMRLWTPILGNEIILRDIVDSSELYSDGSWKYYSSMALNAVVGMYDDPGNQAQLPFTVDFTNGGHFAVCGSVVSGKSTFLQTMVFSFAIKYSPKAVNFYLIDFSSGLLNAFGNLPHTGAVMRDNDLDRVDKFFNMISSVVERRKELFAGGNFSQYIRHNENSVPAVIVVIDNYAGFREKTDNKYEDVIINLSREGVSYGIFLAISSAGFGLSEIPNRIGDNIRTVVSLEMGDKFKYMDVLRATRIDLLPEAGIKGRGLGRVDGRLLEIQTALAVDAEDGYKRNSLIESMCGEMNSKWRGETAQSVPYIPKNPAYTTLASDKRYSEALANRDFIPFAYNFDDASIHSVNLRNVYCYSVSGKRRTGKTNVMKLLLRALKEKPSQKVIIEKESNELKNFVKSDDCVIISSDEEMHNYFSGITADFTERNRFKKRLSEQGYSDKKIYLEMQKFTPIFVFIADLCEFVNSIYYPEDNVGNMNSFFENIFEKGNLHNIYFFACINPDDEVEIGGYQAYRLFTGYKTGVHLGGNTAAQRIYNFQNINYNDSSKASRKGEGLVPSEDDDTVAEKIIIPLIGGNEY